MLHVTCYMLHVTCYLFAFRASVSASTYGARARSAEEGEHEHVTCY